MQCPTKEIPCRRVREMGEIERLSYRVSADQSQKSELSWECEREYKQTALSRTEPSQLHSISLTTTGYLQPKHPYIVSDHVVNQRPIRAFLHFHQMRRANA